jgi:hypothetical protein
MALSLFRRAAMKTVHDERMTSSEDTDQQVSARGPDMPVSEPESPPYEEDEGQTIDEPGYGHGV